MENIIKYLQGLNLSNYSDYATIFSFVGGVLWYLLKYFKSKKKVENAVYESSSSSLCSKMYNEVSKEKQDGRY